MRQSAAKAILSYWHALGTPNRAPAQAAIDPKALKAHLPDLFILERMDRAVFAFRLAGTRLCARYGRELRDHDFIRLWPAEQHGNILARLNAGLQTARPVVLRGTAATLDNDSVAFEVILMPIADASGRVTRLLGAMLTADDNALRLGAHLISQSLETMAPLSGSVRTAEAQPSATFASGRETRVAFLRIVDGGKEARLGGASVDAGSYVAAS